jgi:hypothetical protein
MILENNRFEFVTRYGMLIAKIVKANKMLKKRTD